MGCSHRFIGSIFVLVMLGTGVTSAQVPSELIRMGFVGPVHTVREEFRQYSWEASRWEPMGDPMYKVDRFDRNGRCLTQHLDPGSGWRPYGMARTPAIATGPRQYELVRKLDKSGMGWKTVWQFDQQGRLELFKAYAIYRDGPVLSFWQQYSYDAHGRVEQLTYWANWGRGRNQTQPYPPKRIKYWFDEAGRFGGWTDPDEPRSRSTLTYDREGRLVKQVDENEEGYVRTQAWEGYDQQGNWTVYTVTQSSRTDDEDEPSSQDVTRRSITYRRASNKRSSLMKK